MSKAKNNEHRAQVKLALAAKYDHLKSLANSATKRRTYGLRADAYRRQAQEIAKS
jgi:hypothetical protein